MKEHCNLLYCILTSVWAGTVSTEGNTSRSTAGEGWDVDANILNVSLSLALWGERDRTASQGLISVRSTKHNSKEGEFREWTKGNENTSYKGSSLCSVHHQSFDLPSQYPGAPASQDSCPEQMTTVAFLLDMTPIHWQVLSISPPRSTCTHPSPQPHPLGPGYRPPPAS